MMLNRVLDNNKTINRVIFDPKNKEHRASFKQFLTSGSWGDVQFFPEDPYVTVPETVLRKFSLANLK